MSQSESDKIFVSEESQILDAYRLGEAIYSSGYRPTFIVGLWRGGSTVALVVQECLAYLGVPADHTTIRTSYGGGPSTSNPLLVPKIFGCMVRAMPLRR